MYFPYWKSKQALTFNSPLKIGPELPHTIVVAAAINETANLMNFKDLISPLTQSSSLQLSLSSSLRLSPAGMTSFHGRAQDSWPHKKQCRAGAGWMPSRAKFVRNMKNFDKFTVETITMNFIKNDTRCSYPTMQQQYFLMHFGGNWNAWQAHK